jgi:hypothetical protein
LFRKCLSVLAVQFGFSTSTRRPPQIQSNGDGGIPDTNDAAMLAGAGDLVNPALPCGRRPNGGG